MAVINRCFFTLKYPTAHTMHTLQYTVHLNLTSRLGRSLISKELQTELTQAKTTIGQFALQQH